MFFKPIYIVFISFLLLFFVEKAGAENAIKIISHPHHKLSEHVSAASSRLAKQIIVDSLTDSNEDNGDDETSSKAKHRHLKITITSPLKISDLSMVATLFSIFSFGPNPKTHLRSNLSQPLFGKTPITIAIRCIRI